jgi:ATP-dependent Clp protease ATP-binding subunit ClpB
MKQNAERDGDYGKVAEIRYGKIKEAQKIRCIFKITEDQTEGTSI